MAAEKIQYQVTQKSPLTYNGKRALPGDVVDDLPGADIARLVEGGFIVKVSAPAQPQPEVEIAPPVVEVPEPAAGEVETVTETITVEAGEPPVVHTSEISEPATPSEA